jgi:hypothetical protein
LVLARIEVMPKDFKLSVGDCGTFDKEELIEHVKNRDEVGDQIIEMQMNFIRALTKGTLIKTLNQ